MPLPLGRELRICTDASIKKQTYPGWNGASRTDSLTLESDHTSICTHLQVPHMILLDPSAAVSRFLFFSFLFFWCFRMAMAIENLHLFLPLEFGSLSLGCTYLRHPLLHFRAADHQLCRTRRRPVPSITSESRSRSTWTELRAWRACNPSSSVPQGRSPVTPPIRNDPNHDLLI